MSRSLRPTIEQACAQYVHRYTLEHVPSWARQPHEGRYYAPQFRSDREWYEHTTFPGEPDYIGMGGDCHTTGQTWPLGQWLAAPYEPRTCDMVRSCTAPITHIDRKGYVYCTTHGEQRRADQPCRQLRPHELTRLLRGESLGRY